MQDNFIVSIYFYMAINQHRDSYHHCPGVLDLNLQLHHLHHFHCVVEFCLQIHSNLTKNYCLLQIEHYPDHSAEQVDHLLY